MQNKNLRCASCEHSSGNPTGTRLVSCAYTECIKSRIIDARKRAGLSRGQFARMISLELMAMLDGKIRIELDCSEVDHIAITLQADPGWLLTGIEKLLDDEIIQILKKTPEPDREEIRKTLSRSG